MPLISGTDLSRLRELKQWSEAYLVIHVPNNLLTAKVNDPTLQAGDRAIAFNNGAGGAGYSAVLFDALDEGTTLWVGSYAGGRDEGVVRVKSIERSGWPPTSGTINVAENADIQWENGQFLTVKDEHRVWPKFPRVVVDDSTDPATITWYKDWDIVHSWQTHQEPPVLIMGPPPVALLESGVATARFWADDSYSPRGTGFAAQTWVFPHGTVIGGPGVNSLGTEANPNIVTWTLPGNHTVVLAVQDNNGRWSYGYRPALIRNESECYRDFEIRSMRGNFSSGGWLVNFRVFEDCKVEDFPEGAMAIVVAKDWYGGEKRSIGGYRYREDIVFVGWIKADTLRKEPMTGEVTFQAHTIDGELRNCPGFPISVERVTGTPDNWGEIQNMTLDLAGFYLGYWHSTLYEVTDVLQSGDTRKVKYMDVTESNLYNQLDRGIFNETIFARALSDRQSRMKFDVNPQYLTDAQRNALATIMSIENQDWLGRVDVQEIQEKRISWIDLSAVRVDDQGEVQPVFSLAPGDTPAADGAFKQLTRLVVTNQDDANRLAGYALANLNNPLPRIRVPLQGNYRIFDLHPQEWVEFPSLDTLREARGPGVNEGTPWPTGTRFIPRDIDMSFNNALGSFLVTIGMEAETMGPAGVPGYYPEDPPYIPPPDIPPDDPPDPVEPWPQKVYIGTKSKGMYRTKTFSGPIGYPAGHPIWIPDNAGLGSLAISQMCPDPWDVAHRRFVIAGGDVYRHYNSVSGGAATATCVLTNAQAIALTGAGGGTIDWICGNINKQGYFYVLFHEYGHNTDIYCLRTSNYGNTWTAFPFNNPTAYVYNAFNIFAGAFRGTSSYPAGDVIYAMVDIGAGGGGSIFYSFDNGATWTRGAITASGSQTSAIKVEGADQSIVYAGGDTSVDDSLLRSVDHGATTTEVDGALTLGFYYAGQFWSHIWNKSLARVLRFDHIWKTTDYCISWTDYGLTGKGVDIISVIHDYPDNLYLAKAESGTIPPSADQPHVIFVSNNEGVAMEGKSGAHANQADGGGDSIPYNCGGVAEEGIIQVWTEV